jgi:hypothetical protein
LIESVKNLKTVENSMDLSLSLLTRLKVILIDGVESRGTVDI